MNDLFDTIPEPQKPSGTKQKKIKKTIKKVNSYTAEDITILEGLEPVRKRPGMYIGGIDTKALHHLFNEIIDNSIDEVIAGYADTIDVTLNPDNEIIISDNGRGIPVDPHPKLPNKSALEIILTTLHAGGKFDTNSYKTSGGLHGVGISVVNALSESMCVEVTREKQKYTQKFSRGYATSELILHGETSNNNGTKVTFSPDKDIFEEGIYFDKETLKDIIKTKSYLVRGLKINWLDNRGNGYEKEKLQYYYPNGISDYITEVSASKELLITSKFIGKSSSKELEGIVEWAVIWTSGNKNNIKSYCNTIPTVNGGTHENAFKNAILKSLKKYADMVGVKNSKIINLDDIMSYTDGILSIFISEPEFQGQTKERLSSKSATALTNTIISDNFDHWLSANPDQSNKLIDFFINIANSRISMKQEKDLNRKSVLRKLRLPGKLADCLNEKSDGTEIFIVEGDSAGGSAKQARDKKYQAVLPLRGKILNVASSSAQKYFQNQQLKDLVQALGCGTSDNYDESRLRYEKVIIMTDADVDGAHIAALMITFFFKEMIQLIENKHLYMAVPPLYKLSNKNKIFYANDDDDKDKILKKEFKNLNNVDISRFKGLGEMLPNQLRETTMNKESRKLLQITIENSPMEYYETFIDQIMGSKAEARFKFIQENANFY